MSRHLTNEERRLRRRAAFELRQRAADLLDDASRLDGDPAMRLPLTDVEGIAQNLHIPTETLTEAITGLWPRHPDNPQSKQKER